MVFQSYALFPHMTVLENVAYGLHRVGRAARPRRTAGPRRRWRWSGSRASARGCRASCRAASSSGWRWPARWCCEPQVLLFDEPLSNLDAKLRRQVREEIRELQQRLGITAVYVTHDQAEALAVSDRIIVMSNAAIAQEGTPRELYEEPADRFVADFIGDANIVEAEIVAVDGDVAEVRLGDGHHPAAAPRPRGPVRPCWRSGRRRSCCRPAPAGGVLEGEVLKASYLGSHIEYELGTPVGELFAIDAHASAAAGARDTEVGIRFADRGVTLIPGALSGVRAGAGRRPAPEIASATPGADARIGLPRRSPSPREEVVDPAARLLDQQDAGEAVPGIDVQLEIGVGTPVGDRGQAQRTGAEAAEVDSGREHPLDRREIGGVGQARGPADLDAGPLDPVGRGGHERDAVQGGAAPAPCEVEFVGRRAEDGAELDLPPATNATRDAKTRHPADEIGGAVDRVDHPDPLADLAAFLLAEEGVVGEGFREPARQQALDCGIGLAGIVLRTLEGDREARPALEPVQRQTCRPRPSRRGRHTSRGGRAIPRQLRHRVLARQLVSSDTAVFWKRPPSLPRLVVRSRRAQLRAQLRERSPCPLDPSGQVLF